MNDAIAVATARRFQDLVLGVLLSSCSDSMSLEMGIAMMIM